MQGRSIFTVGVFNLRKILSKCSKWVLHGILILHCLIWNHFSFMVTFHQPHWTLDLAHLTLIQSTKCLEMSWKSGKTDIWNRKFKVMNDSWRGWVKTLLFSFFVILIPVWKPAACAKVPRASSLGPWLKCLEEEHRNQELGMQSGWGYERGPIYSR